MYGDGKRSDKEGAPPHHVRTHIWSQMRPILEGKANMLSLKEASISRAWLVTNREAQLPGLQQSMLGSDPLSVSKHSRPSVNLEKGGRSSISSAKNESIQKWKYHQSVQKDISPGIQLLSSRLTCRSVEFKQVNIYWATPCAGDKKGWKFRDHKEDVLPSRSP